MSCSCERLAAIHCAPCAFDFSGPSCRTMSASSSHTVNEKAFTNFISVCVSSVVVSDKFRPRPVSSSKTITQNVLFFTFVSPFQFQFVARQLSPCECVSCERRCVSTAPRLRVSSRWITCLPFVGSFDLLRNWRLRGKILRPNIVFSIYLPQIALDYFGALENFDCSSVFSARQSQERRRLPRLLPHDGSVSRGSCKLIS